MTRTNASAAHAAGRLSQLECRPDRARTRPFRWTSLLLGAAIAINATAAVAQPRCNDRDSVIALLSGKYREQPVALGVANNGNLVEVLSTDKGDTWTIIVTTPRGVSCLVAAGEGWHTLEQTAALEPEA
ncbi:MAG: hypothetical protein AAF495_06390 [Pseudomonadota bacterium]